MITFFNMGKSKMGVKTACTVIITLSSSLFVLRSASAQSLEQMGGVYYAYPVTETTLAAAPEGYEPFYISHYGRHGSRWLPNDKRYTWVIRQFGDKNRLTKLGKSVRKRMDPALYC